MFEEDWLGGSFTLGSDKLDGMCLRKIGLEVVSHWTQTDYVFEEDWLGGSFTLDSDKLDGMCLRKIGLEVVSHWTQTS